MNNDCTNNRKHYGYVRVSSADQRKGFSIDSQRKSLIRIAEENHLELNHIFEEDPKSAFKNNVHRKEFDKLIAEVRSNNVDTIVIWKLDRLVRDHKKNDELFELFTKHKVKIISCTERELNYLTADSRADIRKKGVDNQYESERTVERTKASLFIAAELGNYPKSKVPLGYRRKHKEFKAAPIVPDETLGPQVIHLFEKIVETRWGISKMLNYLNSTNYMNRHWSEAYLYYILENVIYIGTYINRRNKPQLKIKNHTEALVPVELFKQVQDIIHSRNYEKKYEYPYKGYVYCKQCDRKMIAMSAHNGRSSNAYLYYTCKCCHRRINQKKFDILIVDSINKKIIDDYKSEVINNEEQKIRRLDAIIRNLDEYFIESIIDDEYYSKEKNNYLSKRKEIMKSLELYKKMHNLSWSCMSYQSKRIWLEKNIIKIYYDFDTKECIINYK